MSEDLRQYPRAPVRLKVEYESQNAFFADYTRNLSRGGVFIQTEQPLALGTDFSFSLAVPERDEPFVLRGRVAWINQPKGPGAPSGGMGVSFLWEDDATKQAFELEAERLMRNSLGRGAVRTAHE